MTIEQTYRNLHRRYLGLVTATMAMAALAPQSATAQNIDYTSLEEIFQEPITRAANGTPQRASEVAATVDIVTAEDIRKSGAQTIPAAIRHLAGIDFSQFSSTQQEVAVRGYGGPFTPRLMVLLNGRPVYLSIFGLVSWEQLPVTLNEIRQIEVVRGPSTALFGFNALAGAINIVTYNPLFDDQKSAQVRISSEGDARISAALNYKLADNLGLRVSAQHKYIQRFERDGRAISGGFEDSDTSTLFGELIYSSSGGTTLSVEGSYTDGELNAVTPNYIPSRATPRTWSIRARGVHVTDFGEFWLDSYINNAKYDLGRIAVGSAPVTTQELSAFGEFEERLNTIQAGIVVSSLDNLTLRAVGEYRYNRVLQNLQVITPSPVEKLSFDLYSLSGLVDWDVTDRLNFSATVRYDSQDVNAQQIIPRTLSPTPIGLGDLVYDGVSANLSASFKIDATKTLRLTGSRGVRVPSAAELALFASEPALGLLLVGNANLEPTVVYQGEASFEWLLPADDIRFRLTAFYQDNQNLTSLFGSIPVPIDTAFGTVPVFQSQNIANSEAFGVEIEYEQDFGNGFKGAQIIASLILMMTFYR